MTDLLIILALLILGAYIVIDTVLVERRVRRRRRIQERAAADLADMTTKMEQEPNRFWFRTGRDSAIADMHDALRHIETKDEP